MSKKSASTPVTFASGQGVADLEKALRQLVADKQWDARNPLPTTRELGAAYGISNASVSRLLQRLDEDETLWRRDNGRYYLKEGRRLFERRKPYACLLRQLQMWSRMYQGIMGGFSRTFERNKAAMLFIHNETLVRHADTAHPPVHAGAAAQRESLAEFFHDHQNQFGGILLDDVWLDDVLAEFADQLTNAVIVCRPTRLPGLSSVSVDFDSSALLAVGHLYARGYEEIWLAVPFATSVPIDLMAAAAVQAAEKLGSPIETRNIHSVATPKERERLLEKLQATSKRIGIFCLEDNVALILWRSFAKAGLDCPARVGLLSGMGTGIVADHHLSSVWIDYERLGTIAGEILTGGVRKVITVPTQLMLGAST